MFRSYWIIAATLGLAIIIAGLWSWNIFSGYQSDNTEKYQETANDEISSAEHGPISHVSVMLKEGFFIWLPGFHDTDRSDNEAKRAQYDLKAQQDMSAWALGMFIVTIWLTGITLLGVIFVWRTLVATRDMAKDTRRIGEAQTRAHLDLSGSGQFTNSDPEECAIEISFNIRNSGVTKAKNIDVSIKIFRRLTGEREWIFMDDGIWRGNLASNIPPSSAGSKMLDRTMGPLDIAIEKMEIRVIAEIKYSDVFDNHWYNIFLLEGESMLPWREKGLPSFNLTQAKPENEQKLKDINHDLGLLGLGAFDT